jgi:chromosome segregation protein
MQWLTKHGLEKKARLGQSIEVDRGWEYALEKVLGASLQAICVEKIDDIVPLASDFKIGNLNVVSHASLQAPLNKKHTLLLDKVKSPWPLEALLTGIYIAESEEEALSMRDTLAPHESVVTQEGLWLGASWLRIMRDDNPEAGVFQRTQELKQLVKKIESLTEEESTLTQKQAEMREQLKQLEIERTQLQKEVQRFHAQSAEKQAQEKMKKERLRELQKQAERFQKEQEEAASQWQEASRELTLSRDRWQASLKAIEEETDNREALQKEREYIRSVLQHKRDEVNQAKEAAHQLEIRWETTKSQHASLQQNVTRMQGQLKTLTERQDLLQKEWETIGSLETVKQQLSDALGRRLEIEAELNNARSSMDTINQEWHAMEMKRQEIEREIAHFRDILETLRIDWQGLKVKSETLLPQIKETGHEIETILQHLSAESNATEWHAELEQVTQRIARLGAINLVAIEEYSTCSERKEYLDKQYADLQEGLTTLESAIAKIDKETRTRFKETFDTVNTCFQELFPKIFGGGRAYLELTGDNLLDSGVTVMACPPGKRNSTIHLLSGGEKAMTAIALVFSIFHLNPAPFCLLDEVDAPLDDANIGRFCQLVKSMAEKTQFIFISHNKLAIEMAEHLMGVTMHEPGVSRLVSVDVHEAVSLAGA